MRKNYWILLVVGRARLRPARRRLRRRRRRRAATTEVTVEDDRRDRRRDLGRRDDRDHRRHRRAAAPTAEDVYNACIDAVEGTAAESAGQTACSRPRRASSSAPGRPRRAGGERPTPRSGICQQAADQAVKSLESAELIDGRDRRTDGDAGGARLSGRGRGRPSSCRDVEADVVELRLGPEPLHDRVDEFLAALLGQQLEVGAEADVRMNSRGSGGRTGRGSRLQSTPRSPAASRIAAVSSGAAKLVRVEVPRELREAAAPATTSATAA